MIPIQLVLHNFMCYRSHEGELLPPLDLDGLRVVCLSGENGAGKSALLDAITWALWGEARLSDDELVAQGEQEMMVELIFDLAGQRFRIVRRRQRGSATKRGRISSGKSSLDLQVADGARWRPLGETGVRETQQRIDDLLRMRYKTFINASFLLQGRADEFTRKLPSERKEVLAEILDLGEYAKLEKRAKQRVKGLHDTIQGLRGQIEALQQQAERYDFWVQEATNAAAAVARAEALVVAATQQREQRTQRLAELEGLATRRREGAARLAEGQAEAQQRQAAMAQLRAQIASAEELVSKAPAIEAAITRLEAARNEAAAFERLRPRYEQLREQWRDLNEALKQAARELEYQIQSAQAEQARLEGQLARRAEYQAQQAAAEGALAALAPLAAELHAARAAEQALGDRLAKANEHRLNQLAQQNLIANEERRLRDQQAEVARTIVRLDRTTSTLPAMLAEISTADAAAGRASEIEALLADLRSQTQHLTAQIGSLQQRCTDLPLQAEKLKQARALLAESGSSQCPICRSDLGEVGLGHALAHYDEQIVALRAEFRTAREQRQAHQERLMALESALTDAERDRFAAQERAAALGPLREQVARAEAEAAELVALREQQRHLAAQIAEADFAREAREALLGIDADLRDLSLPDRAALQAAEAERTALRATIAQLERQLERQPSLLAQRQTSETALAELDQVAALLPPLTTQIADLQRQLASEDFAHAQRTALAQTRAEADALGYDGKAVQALSAEIERLREWEPQAQALSQAQVRLSADRDLLARDEQLQARLDAELARLIEEDRQLEAHLRELPQARLLAQEAQAALDGAQRTLQVAERDLGEKRSELRRAEAARQQVAQAREALRQEQLRHDLFDELATACGKKGVQAMLIETAIPQIEDEANRLLARMTDNQMHVAFAMQRETKKGDTAETLDITIADALGTRPYDAFSGGEAMRANFAIRIALSRLLARRAGARLETLVIDEGFGTLDATGRERMVEAITEVQHDFQRIIVITHIDDLKERFPAQIEIVKTPTGSVWELR